MHTLLIALLSIAVLYFIFAILKASIKRLTGIPVCAICAAVSLTWIALLTLYFLGYSVNVILIAILMGQSVAGSMYKLEKIFKDKKLTNFWIFRLGIILFGTAGVFLVLVEEFDFLVFLAILAILFGALTLFFVKEEGDEIKALKKEHSGFWNKAAREMRERMKNCC